MLRIALVLVSLIASPVLSAPERYRLDPDRSTVSFSYTFEGAVRTGQMPVATADLVLDLDDVSASAVSVTLNARAAKAGFIFATQAMKSREVLDTARFPTIHFRSTRFRGDLQGATVTGDLTIRGTTRPVTLEAALFRQRGTPVGDRRNLLVLLTGRVSRAEFGAGGYPGFVGDRIGLRIIARITK